MNESTCPKRPGILSTIPPLETALAKFPLESMQTAPTVSRRRLLTESSYELRKFSNFFLYLLNDSNDLSMKSIQY